MGHFAKVENGTVINVIVAEQDFIDTLPDKDLWIKTSYNTRGNQHYDPQTGHNDSNIHPPLRGNYAQVGGIYNPTYDVFYAQQPYPSWILSHSTWLWEPPIPYPNDGKQYEWDEATQQWVELKKP